MENLVHVRGVKLVGEGEFWDHQRDRYHKFENMSDKEWERYCKELCGDDSDYAKDIEYDVEEGEEQKAHQKAIDDLKRYKKRYEYGGINEDWEVELKKKGHKVV